jgi:hypothetical protein
MFAAFRFNCNSIPTLGPGQALLALELHHFVRA